MASPEARLGLGLAVGAVVIGLYQKGMPNSADVRAGKPGDEHLEAVRKQNAWMAAGTVAGISLLAKDPTIFIIGGMMVVALDVITRVNNFTNPVTGGMMENPFAAETAAEPAAETSNYAGYDYAVN